MSSCWLYVHAPPRSSLRPKKSVYGVVLLEFGLGPIDGLVPLDGFARQVLEHPMRGSVAAVVRYHVVSANCKKQNITFRMLKWMILTVVYITCEI